MYKFLFSVLLFLDTESGSPCLRLSVLYPLKLIRPFCPSLLATRSPSVVCADSCTFAGIRNFKSSSPTFLSSKNLDTESGSPLLCLSFQLPLSMFRSPRSPLLCYLALFAWFGLNQFPPPKCETLECQGPLSCPPILNTEPGSSRLLLSSTSSVSRTLVYVALQFLSLVFVTSVSTMQFAAAFLCWEAQQC